MSRFHFCRSSLTCRDEKNSSSTIEIFTCVINVIKVTMIELFEFQIEDFFLFFIQYRHLFFLCSCSLFARAFLNWNSLFTYICFCFVIDSHSQMWIPSRYRNHGWKRDVGISQFPMFILKSSSLHDKFILFSKRSISSDVVVVFIGACIVHVCVAFFFHSLWYFFLQQATCWSANGNSNIRMKWWE